MILSWSEGKHNSRKGVGKTGERLCTAGGALSFLLDSSDANGPTSPIGPDPTGHAGQAALVVSDQMTELLH